MMKKIIVKILLTIFLFIFLFLGIVFYGGYKFYKSIFRLSYGEINLSLSETTSQCKKLADCKLLPGDILIRRYITHVTDLFSKTLNPYFTHSVMYLGNDELFEALGNYETPENQIQITKLSKSDWLNEDINNFVVIRPKDYKGKLDKIISNLKDVASDPGYIFGPLNEEKKTASCSDLILSYLLRENVIGDLSNNPEIITPDYLFWATQEDRENFMIIGYNISK